MWSFLSAGKLINFISKDRVVLQVADELISGTGTEESVNIGGGLDIQIKKIAYSSKTNAKNYVKFKARESAINQQYLIVYDDSEGQSALNVVEAGNLQTWLQSRLSVKSDFKLGQIVLENSEISNVNIKGKITVFFSDRKAEVILGENIYGDGNGIFEKEAIEIQNYLLERTPTNLEGVCSGIINSKDVNKDDLKKIICPGSTFNSGTSDGTMSNEISREVLKNFAEARVERSSRSDLSCSILCRGSFCILGLYHGVTSSNSLVSSDGLLSCAETPDNLLGSLNKFTDIDTECLCI